MNKLLHEIHRLRKLIRDAQSEIELAPRVLKAHQTKLAGLETALADGKEAMKKAKANILTLEANIKSTTHAIAKHEKQLDGLTAPREIAAKETDIKTAKAQIAQHEEELMAAMTDADDRTARIPDLEAALAKGKLDFAAYEKAATDRAKRLKSELTSATKTLTEEDKKIPTDMRNSYDRLVRTHGADALTALEGRSCKFCRMGITVQQYTQLQRSEFSFCRSCGRVLYLVA